ncbi:MAG: GntR family transcriptional regulator [Deltaproteobacteria bacterium]|nr:GntR family transcriptional regulator [Deltaproteobacteria bacterium]
MSKARRPNLSESIANDVRERIIAGELAAGERINEVHLASLLEVSRTPIREALTRLVSEGFVAAKPRRGFFVQDLDDVDIEHLYQIRAVLDPAALELGGLPSSDTLAQLERINEEILETRGDPSRTVDVDDRWHLTLLAHCPNEILLDLVRQFIARTRPFEHAYMRENCNVQVVVREHRAIAAFLTRGDLPGACGALFQNMQSAVAPLLEWRRHDRERRRLAEEND